MLIEIDFNSSEAIYVQLQNQIIMGIATDMIREGDTLPSVRQLADTVGINMHTVNKAYSILRQEGFIQLDRRRGAVVAIDADKAQAMLNSGKSLRYYLQKDAARILEEKMCMHWWMRYLTSIEDRQKGTKRHGLYKAG